MKDMSSVTNYLDMDNKELFNIYSQDKSNKEVRDILIERNLYLVNILAKKYINKGVEFEDLYQVGSLALIYAIERYDMSKGYEFSSFATPTIIGEIKKYFRDKVWTMRVPRRVQELNKKVNEAKLLLEQQNKKKPKVKEIAEYIGCREEEVLEALEASYGYQPVSLDSPINGDSEDTEVTLIDKIGGQEDSFSNIEYKDFIEEALDNNTPVDATMKKYGYIISYIRQSVLKYGAESRGRMKNVGIKLTQKQVAAIILKLDSIDVPKEICYKNRYWDPLVLDFIYNEYDG